MNSVGMAILCRRDGALANGLEPKFNKSVATLHGRHFYYVLSIQCSQYILCHLRLPSSLGVASSCRNDVVYDELPSLNAPAVVRDNDPPCSLCTGRLWMSVIGSMTVVDLCFYGLVKHAYKQYCLNISSNKINVNLDLRFMCLLIMSIINNRKQLPNFYTIWGIFNADPSHGLCG